MQECNKLFQCLVEIWFKVDYVYFRFIFIVIICQFCQKLMGSRNPLLRIDGFLGAQEPILTRPLLCQGKTLFCPKTIAAIAWMHFFSTSFRNIRNELFYSALNLEGFISLITAHCPHALFMTISRISNNASPICPYKELTLKLKFCAHQIKHSEYQYHGFL